MIQESLPCCGTPHLSVRCQYSWVVQQGVMAVPSSWIKLFVSLCLCLLAARWSYSTCVDDYRNCTSPILASRKLECGKPSTDMCTIYQSALKCINETNSTCVSDPSVSSNISSLTSTQTALCQPDVKCKERIAGCAYGTSLDLNFTNACAVREAYLSCLNLTGECATEPSIKSDLLPYTMYDVYCTKADICKPAVNCVSDVLKNRTGVSSQGSIDVCSAVSENLLTCVDQPNCSGGIFNVSGHHLNAAMEAVCTEVKPFFANLSQCQNNSCVELFEITANASLPTRVDFLINLTMPEFWCPHLINSLKCIHTGAQSCSLPANVTARVEEFYNNTVSLCAVNTATSPPTVGTTPTSGSSFLSQSVTLLLAAYLTAISPVF